MPTPVLRDQADGDVRHGCAAVRAEGAVMWLGDLQRLPRAGDQYDLVPARLADRGVVGEVLAVRRRVRRDQCLTSEPLRGLDGAQAAPVDDQAA